MLSNSFVQQYFLSIFYVVLGSANTVGVNYIISIFMKLIFKWGK